MARSNAAIIRYLRQNVVNTLETRIGAGAAIVVNVSFFATNLLDVGCGSRYNLQYLNHGESLIPEVSILTNDYDA